MPALARLVVLVCIGVPWGCAPVLKPNDPVLGDLHWMVGAWAYDHGDRLVEEHWIQPEGGTMLGVNRTVNESGTSFFEYLRIERSGDEVVLLASPLGRCPPTPFVLVDRGKRRAVFENPEHDFPQRIIYWREGNALFARIEGVADGQERASNWRMERAQMQIR